MATRDKLKEWFSTGKYPTEAQFAEWIDSYIHKDDNITIDNIEGLSAELSEHSESLSNLATEIATLSSDLNALSGEVEKKQEILTAGAGIDIKDNVISITIDTTLYKVVTTLPDAPDTDDTNKIFLILSENGEESNIYSEYIWVDEAWEKIGELPAEKINLDDYYTKEDVDKTIDEVKESLINRARCYYIQNWTDCYYATTTYDNSFILHLRACGDNSLTFKVDAEIGDIITIRFPLSKETVSVMSPTSQYPPYNSSLGGNFGNFAISSVDVSSFPALLDYIPITLPNMYGNTLAFSTFVYRSYSRDYVMQLMYDGTYWVWINFDEDVITDLKTSADY